MNDEIKQVIEKYKKVKDILKTFDNREEAIEYLVSETKLSTEECDNAYDIIMNLKN